MKRLMLLLIAVSAVFLIYSQTLTLQECQNLMQTNFPLAKQKGLIDEVTNTTIEALMSQYFPQFRLNGQATYQSDVTKIELNTPEGFPKLEIPTPEKDQYKLYMDVSQTIFGSSIFGVQQKITRAEAEQNKQQIEIELYKLKDKVNQLYFGILLADEQIKQTEILNNDLNTALDKIKVMVKNGVSLETNQLNLEAELMTLNQNIRNIKVGRKALLDVLGKLIGRELNRDTQLSKPTSPALTASEIRPELTLIDYKKNTLNLQNQQLIAQNVPEVALFLQGGWGKPALNMFSNKFEPYYIGGIRLQWNISRLYTFSREKRNISNRMKMYDIEKEVFKLNNQIEQTQQRSKISQLENSLESDNDLISLRKKIKQTAQVQLENGVITSAEFIREANAENQARQTKSLHEIQLLEAENNLKWINTTP
ncbi:MAG: TolC family protein [Paludibacteraceae bacterium]